MNETRPPAAIARRPFPSRVGGPVASRFHRALPPLLLLAVACAADRSPPVATGHPTWTTEAAHLFGDAPERSVFFSRPYVRADPARDRIVVLDAAGAQVSAWSPAGSLLFVVGRSGEGPG